MKRRNTITAVLFLLMTVGGFLLLATSFLGGEGKFETLLKRFAGDRDVGALLAESETAINQDLDRDHLFIQLYGGIQHLTGRRMVEDAVGENTVVKLSTGALNFVKPDSTAQPAETVAANAAATAAFARELEKLHIPYLYVMAPQKIQRGQDLLPLGMAENGNSSADAFLEELEQWGVFAYDLRPSFENNGIYSNWFFQTDHHWKPEAAFFAWQHLAQILDHRYGFVTADLLTDPADWTTTVLDDFFLGSQGKRVGSLYAGVDDFTIYTPKFDTKLTYSSPDGGFERTGTFNQSVCFPERVAKKDWFNGNPYTYYSGGDYGIATMTNHKNPNGPKLVLLRESFSCALAPFLAMSCSELTTIDLRHFSGDLLETIEGLDPDLVLTMYAASSTGLEQMFAFDGAE
nr:DHHW family protein [uncultured Flavonifractor sp.]